MNDLRREEQYRRVVIQLQKEDLDAIRWLRKRWGLPSDAAAVRFALRIAHDAYPVIQQQTEVEK